VIFLAILLPLSPVFSRPPTDDTQF
jgi:hypothetical protein